MKFDNGTVHVEITFGGVLKGIVLGGVVVFCANKIIDHYHEKRKDAVRNVVREEIKKTYFKTMKECGYAE